MDDLSLVDPSLLPPQMRQLVALIGLPETLRLLHHCGGVPCYIPQTTDRSQLKHVLAPASLEALANSPLAGRTIEMPKDDKIVKQLRNLAVRTAAKETNKVRTARQFRLSRRHVINICQDGDENPTLDLFEKGATE